MTGSAVSLAAAVLLALTAPTAEAVAFLTVATAVPFLLGAAAMGSSIVAFLRVAGWADATHARASRATTQMTLVLIVAALCCEE
jgi:hypothetical protein